MTATAIPSRSPAAWRVIWIGAWRRGWTKTGVALIALVLLIALIGPFVAPYSPTAFVGPGLQGPTAIAPLGTDALGRDVLSRVLHGGWTVVWMSLASATLGTIVGAALGLVAGYAGGFVGAVIMRICDVLLALPMIILALMFVSMIGSSPGLIVLLVALGHVPQVARVTYGATLEVIEREFIQWARAVGLPQGRVLLGEVLPNVSGPVLVDYGIRIVWSVGIIATLGVLGVGMQPPAADWGLMINDNRVGMALQPLAVLVPLLLIAAFAVGTNLVTDSIGRSLARVNDGVAG